ncbi:MAG TPA: hypothetical protein ENO21_04255 [Firmicutes bacterium]|nr:hypothetical protein [Bacillota bacterium]
MAVAKSNAKQNTARKPLQKPDAPASQAPNSLGAEAASQTRAYKPVLGICSTCRHLPRCLFVKAARQPIQFCEEFDERAEGGEGETVGLAERSQVVTDGQGVDPGICVNCDSRLTCMHRKPGETVYECQDYS